MHESCNLASLPPLSLSLGRQEKPPNMEAQDQG